MHGNFEFFMTGIQTMFFLYLEEQLDLSLFRRSFPFKKMQLVKITFEFLY